MRIPSHFVRASAWREPEAIGSRRERQHRRFLLDSPVRIEYLANNVATEVQAISQNMSIGGFLVKSATPIPKHTPVTFIISIQGELAIHPLYLRGEGEIVRVEERREDVMFAIAVDCKVPITLLEEHGRLT